VTSVAAGAGHTCVIRSGGVECWGNNLSGQLGEGTFDSGHLMPPAMPAITGATAIAAGSNHTCAILSSGSLRCWGDNFNGQVGDGMMGNRATPSEVLTGVKAIYGGPTANHSCAVLASGGLRCWGSNNYQQLGDGSNVDRNAPVSGPTFCP